jgi:hypothetical protein
MYKILSAYAFMGDIMIFERITNDLRKCQYKPRLNFKDGVCYASVVWVPADVRADLDKEYQKIQKNYDDSRYGCFHKIPLCFGGDNSPNNLIRMTKREHTIFEQGIIEPQINKINSLRHSQSASNVRYNIVLPIMRGKEYYLNSFEFDRFLKVFVKTTGIGLSDTLIPYTMSYKLRNLTNKQNY